MMVKLTFHESDHDMKTVAIAVGNLWLEDLEPNARLTRKGDNLMLEFSAIDDDFVTNCDEIDVRYDSINTISIYVPTDIVPRFLEELESLAENADIEKKYIRAAHDEYGNAVRDNSRASLIEIGKKLIG